MAIAKRNDLFAFYLQIRKQKKIITVKIYI